MAGTQRGPTFLFIGPGRAGSTWFTEILREHPDVFVPPNKGTFFFSHHYHMGVSWYESFFARARESVTGEVCEDYLANPTALARARDYNPDVRLICCLRNPYERALSSWRFFGRNGRGEPTLLAQVKRNPAVFDHGCYATQLESAFSIFREEQVLIFTFEELASDPQSVARRLYRFIGVDPGFDPPSLCRRINGNSLPRSRHLARIAHDVHIRSWGASRFASNVIGHVKRIRPLRRLVQRALWKDARQTANWRDCISEFSEEMVIRYEREISALERMLGLDLADWHAMNIIGNEPGSSSDSCHP